jgi:hypothetical protein
MRWGRLALWTLGLVAAREAWLALGPRRWRRQEGYAAAKARAEELGLPLLVVGAPSAGFVNVALTDYGCGDLCVDLEGCPGCERAVTGRAEDVLPMLPDGSAVAFVSCTLEYVDDVERVWRELRRIAGREVYAVTVEPWSLTAFFFPGAQRRILAAPAPGSSGGISYRPLPWARAVPALPALEGPRRLYNRHRERR